MRIFKSRTQITNLFPYIKPYFASLHRPFYAHCRERTVET